MPEVKPVLFFTRSGPGVMYLDVGKPLWPVRVVPEFIKDEGAMLGLELASYYRDRVFHRQLFSVPLEGNAQWVGWEIKEPWGRWCDRREGKWYLLLEVYVEQVGVAI